VKIIEKFKNKKPVISFEVFPPRLDMAIESIYSKILQYKELKPDFMSVTYGAGGSKRDRTIEIASKIQNEYGIECMAHFTCVGHSVEGIDEMLQMLSAHNVENILALRGDPPVNQPDFDYSQNAYEYASELIEHIHSKKNFCVSAAAYVEGHVSCKTLKEDLFYLKEKVDMGVDLLITQLFFDNRLFYDFLDKAEGIGIKCPVSAGIMPIYKAEQMIKMAALCGASIPAKLLLIIDKYKDNPEDMQKAGIEYAGAQVGDLIQNGVAGVHLMTMNKPDSARTILDLAGL